MSEGGARTPTVGYYVHHHGSGHRARFEKIRARSPFSIVALSELDIEGCVRLDSDVPVSHHDTTAGGVLHWAPLASGGPALRVQQIVDWIVRVRPIGVVIDVSAETALLCRLAGVATVVIRQHGDRTDPAHVAAYSSAARLIAPYPFELEHPDTPDWIVAKTDHVGFIGHDTVRGSSGTRSDVPASDDVVVLWGTGGGTFGLDDLEALVDAAMPGRVWTIGSALADLGAGAGAIDIGWVDDVEAMLVNEPVVVASAGNNAVADAAGAGCPLVVVPQRRPFDEQFRHAESLDRAGVAAVAPCGRGVTAWSSALELARGRSVALAALTGDRNGAREALTVIERAFGVDAEPADGDVE